MSKIFYRGNIMPTEANRTNPQISLSIKTDHSGRETYGLSDVRQNTSI
jgi:hypothetical protein